LCTSDRNEIYLVGKVTDEELISFSAALAGKEPDASFLCDTATAGPHLKSFLSSIPVTHVLPVGPQPSSDLESRLGVVIRPTLSWSMDRASIDGHNDSSTIVLCPTQPRSLFLQAACLAGVCQATLVRIPEGDASSLAALVSSFSKAREVICVGFDPRN